MERIIFPVYNTLQHQAPVEADTWTETLQTVEDGNLCPQYDISQSEPIGNTESNIFSASVLYLISRPKSCDDSIVKIFTWLDLHILCGFECIEPVVPETK